VASTSFKDKDVEWERMVSGKEWKGNGGMEDVERERARERESEKEQLRTWFSFLRAVLSALREDSEHGDRNMEEGKKRAKEIEMSRTIKAIWIE